MARKQHDGRVQAAGARGARAHNQSAGIGPGALRKLQRAAGGGTGPLDDLHYKQQASVKLALVGAIAFECKGEAGALGGGVGGRGWAARSGA